MLFTTQESHKCIMLPPSHQIHYRRHQNELLLSVESVTILSNHYHRDTGNLPPPLRKLLQYFGQFSANFRTVFCNFPDRFYKFPDRFLQFCTPFLQIVIFCNLISNLRILLQITKFCLQMHFFVDLSTNFRIAFYKFS